MANVNTDEKIISQFLHFFTKLILRKKTALLVRVLDSCEYEAEVETILRGLNNLFSDFTKESERRAEIGTSSINHDLENNMSQVDEENTFNDENNMSQVEEENSINDENSMSQVDEENTFDFSNSVKIEEDESEVELFDGDKSGFIDDHNNSKIVKNIEIANIESKGDISSPLNISTDSNSPAGPKYCVPEDLQSLIISANSQLNIQFTFSQRMNTQMVVGGFLLSKKRGPYTTSSTRLRSISWKCVTRGCPYHALTLEGRLRDNGLDSHNHLQQPELLVKRETRFKLIQKIAEGEASETAMSHFVEDTMTSMKELQPDVLDMIGSLDSLKQAANRFKRKQRQREGLTFKDEVSEPLAIKDEVPAETVTELNVCRQCSSCTTGNCNDCEMINNENTLSLDCQEIGPIQRRKKKRLLTEGK